MFPHTSNAAEFVDVSQQLDKIVPFLSWGTSPWRERLPPRHHAMTIVSRGVDAFGPGVSHDVILLDGVELLELVGVDTRDIRVWPSHVVANNMASCALTGFGALRLAVGLLMAMGGSAAGSEPAETSERAASASDRK